MADNTWEHPVAMAIPKEGYFKLEQGRYGPIFPRPRPATVSPSSPRSCREVSRSISEYGKKIEEAVTGAPDCPRAAEAPLSSLGLCS